MRDMVYEEEKGGYEGGGCMGFFCFKIPQSDKAFRVYLRPIFERFESVSLEEWSTGAE